MVEVPSGSSGLGRTVVYERAECPGRRQARNPALHSLPVAQVLSDDFVRELSEAVVGRPESFLADSTALLHDDLAERFAAKRVLFLGGAGFIATQTLRHILRYEPSYVGLVDISEYGLAESIRSLRASDLSRRAPGSNRGSSTSPPLP